MSKREEKVHLSNGPTTGAYIWSCPGCNGTYSWSKQINAMWGHPDDKAFCAVCFKYYEITNLDQYGRVI
ncbi:hypothetical protein [Brevibacillus borstelensis]|uniref:hypothetical protein n=1 Tax=Brevibacillus borstelensis TaxID=45462 RepID=UPI0030BBE67D